MPNYRVQVADRESGEEHSVIIEAESESDVREHPAVRMFLIGSITACDESNSPGIQHPGYPQGSQVQRSELLQAETERQLRVIVSRLHQIEGILKACRLVTQPVRTIARGIILVWLLSVAVIILFWILMGVFASVLVFA